MPIAGFICPDGQRISTEECLKECRLKSEFPTGRCKALPFLKRAARDRLWDGTPSVTQLLQGTRETWLKITRDYHIDPDRKTAAMIGTTVHNLMYRLTDSEYAEEKLLNEILQGTYDMYDPETQTLYDYKTWGTWKVAKILAPKDPHERADALFDVALQLNQYRLLLQEKYPDLPVRTIAVQVISRESGLKQAKTRGITTGSPVLIIPVLSDSLVKDYYSLKEQRLRLAIETDYAPPCRAREHWNTKKCVEFCEVRELCNDLQTRDDPQWTEYEIRLDRLEREILDAIADQGQRASIQKDTDLIF